MKARLGEIFGLLSLVIDTDRRGLLKLKGELFVFFFIVYSSLHRFISLPSQNKFSFIRQMAQFLNTDLQSI